MTTVAVLLTWWIASQAPLVRPEVESQVKDAFRLINDLEEQKALDSLNALAARKDLAAAELAAVEVHRGVALMGLNQRGEAERAFSLARACNSDAGLPTGVSPKIRDVFKGSVASECPVKAAAPAPAPTQPDPVVLKPVEVPATLPAAPLTPREDGGVSVLGIAGTAVAAVGGAVLAVALVSMLGSAGAVLGSYPVQAGAHAAEQARQARQQNMVALVLRLGGATVLGVAGWVGMLATAVLVGGGATAAWGFLR